MTPEEIKKELELIRLELLANCCNGNELWERKNKLRDEYKKITGEEI